VTTKAQPKEHHRLGNPRPGENTTPESVTLSFRAVFETFL
jgi:hypothetical protein